MGLVRSGLVIRYIATVGFGLLAAPSSLHASGFAVPEMSIAGLGTANALVANPEEIGAIPYNPSAMAFQEHSSLSAGLMLINPSLEVATGESDLSTALSPPALKGGATWRFCSGSASSSSF